MSLGVVQNLGIMVVCLLLIILLVKILFYVRKQADKVQRLDERLKLMENMNMKEDKE